MLVKKLLVAMLHLIGTNEPHVPEYENVLTTLLAFLKSSKVSYIKHERLKIPLEFVWFVHWDADKTDPFLSTFHYTMVDMGHPEES